MSILSLVFEDNLFTELDKPLPTVERIFESIIQELINYLNELPCLSDIQSIRVTNGKTSTKWTTPFAKINSIDTGHWYIFNKGGRNEMQFNIGMYSAQCGAYLRIGAGFNFDRARFGDPPKVAREFSSFTSRVRSDRGTFEDFFRNQSLMVEFIPSINGSTVVDWLQREALKEPDGHEDNWVFIGKQLHRGKDRKILENADLLIGVIESVFSGFKMFY
jgi:hypothetical protein